MPRPTKLRRVCAAPRCCRFGPKGERACSGAVVMTLDEFECIRLIDLAGFTQQQCARQMNVARTTVQAVYQSARKKLAECLVGEKELQIEGGKITFSGDRPKGDLNNMKIAATYQNGEIFQHFGHTEQFKIYDVQNGKIASGEIVSAGGFGHGALAGFLKNLGAQALICGGIGGGAKTALAETGIELYAGVSGSADAAVEALLQGTLAYSADANCDHHHDHGEGHSCGSHGCGNH